MKILSSERVAPNLLRCKVERNGIRHIRYMTELDTELELFAGALDVLDPTGAATRRFRELLGKVKREEACSE